MTPETFFEGLAFVATLFGCTWHLSGKLTRIELIATQTKIDFDKHVDRDDQRFGEVFRQTGTLAREHLHTAQPSLTVSAKECA